LNQKDELAASFIEWLRTSVYQQLAETNTRLELEHDSAKVKVAHVLLGLDRQGLLDRMSQSPADC
jgi:hypothetical protein